jgi:putative DNA primase/helicase
LPRKSVRSWCQHAKEAGEFYNFKVPLDAEYKIGRSWAGEPADTPQPITQADLDAISAGLKREGIAPINIDLDGDDADLPLHPPTEVPEITHHGAAQAVEFVASTTPDREFPPLPSGPDDPPLRVNGHDRSAQAGNGAKHYPHGEQRNGHIIATYIYRNHLGDNHTKIEKRAGTKRTQYPQAFWIDGHWATEKPAGWQKVPYRLPELLAALAKHPTPDVFLPEGEKDCDTLTALDLIATTNSEGATPLIKAKSRKWTPELNKWFSGVRRLFILVDNDEVGRAFAQEKARALKDIVPDIRIIYFSDAPEGEDISWWLQHGHTKEELLARCEAAPQWQAEELESVRADQVVMRAIVWLWLNRFSIGKIGIVAGLPDEGKGQVLCYIAARNTCGLEWPNGEGRSPQGNVIILSAEEDPSDSLAPRLAAAGADLSRIHFVKMVRDRDEKTGQPRKRMFSLVNDLEKLRQKIIEVGDVITVLIDPISAYLGVGKVDSYRDTDVRAVLGPLKELAEEMRVAIITVMHFNKKADVTNALLRVSNSMAFVGLPRHVYSVVADSENQRKLFVRAKNNDAAESDNQTLSYHFDVREVGVDPTTGKPIRAPFIVWDVGYVDITATEAMQAASENKSPGTRDTAKKFLLNILTDDREVPVKEVKEAGEGNGISWRSMQRAKEALEKDGWSIIADKDRSKPDGKWFWKLVQ